MRSTLAAVTFFAACFTYSLASHAELNNPLGGAIGGVGDLGTPGVDSIQLEQLIKRAEEANQLVDSATNKVLDNQFVIRGFQWMTEDCGRIKDAQGLLNCEDANLRYVDYSQSEGLRAKRLYELHTKAADKAIRLYKKQKPRRRLF